LGWRTRIKSFGGDQTLGRKKDRFSADTKASSQFLLQRQEERPPSGLPPFVVPAQPKFLRELFHHAPFRKGRLARPAAS
jgi:hypothetical protein